MGEAGIQARSGWAWKAFILTSLLRGGMDQWHCGTKLLVTIVAVGHSVAAFYATLACSLTVVSLLYLQRHLYVAGSLLALQIFLAVIPLSTPEWSKRWSRTASLAAQEYFPITVKIEDEKALEGKGPFIIGLEPHSALPTAIPTTFTPVSPLLPDSLKPCHGLASSACFHVPLVRHVFWWLGVRPITKASITSLLKKGHSVALIPGGVQEILLAQHDREVAYLRKRTGFIKLAMQQGATVVPAFAFGQRHSFAWWRPGPPYVPAGLIRWISRAVGVVPLIMWGRWGTPLPFNEPMTIVIGRPLELPHADSPDPNEVQKHLQEYITRLERLFQEHKAAAGYPDMKLYIH